MATLLLVFIYIFYIGLGLPDSLLGAAWPAIYPQWQLPVSWASYISVIISLGTVIASLTSARVIKKLGTPVVTVLSTLLAAIGLLSFSLSQNFIFLCLSAIPLGLGAGSIDTALNNYVALHYNAMQMNFLHCFYGVGVTISPYLMSVALGADLNWRGGYRTAFYLQAAITLLAFLSLLLWKKVKKAEPAAEKPAVALTIPQLLKNKKAPVACCVFAGISALESACLIWGSTYLTDHIGLTAEDAAARITLYFAGLTLGRFLSGLFARRLTPWQLIGAGQAFILLAVLLLFFFDSATGAVAALFLVGFGNGPIFPNMTHLTPRLFGEEASQSMIGLQMALSYTSILLTPLLFGVLAEYLGISIFPLFLFIAFLFMTICLLALRGLHQKENRT